MSFLWHVLLEMIIKIAKYEALESKKQQQKEMFLSEETLQGKKSHLVQINSPKYQSFTRQTQFPYKMTLYTNSFTI